MSRASFRLSRVLRLAVTRVSVVFDAACALTVMVLAFMLLNRGLAPNGLDEFLAVRLSVKNVALVVVFLAVWHTCFAVLGLYRTWPRQSFFSTVFGVLRIIAACSLGTLVLSVFTFMSNTGAFNSRVLLSFWVGALAVELWGRALIAGVADYLDHYARDVKHAIIIGSGPLALALYKGIEARNFKDCRVLGFVDTRDPEHVEPEIRGRMIGTLESLEALLCSQPIDQALIAVPVKSCYAEVQAALDTCERIGVEATYFPGIFSTSLARRGFDEEHDLPAVRHHLVPNDHRLVVKRAIDVAGAACGMVMLFPLLVLCAVVTKLTSPGPVLFSQLRYGHNRRQFRMYKFRTMVVDAEQLQAGLEVHNEAQGPVFKIRADPRVTKWGRIMRKLSFDELPQLINVLKGDMSLVGPRPLPVRDVMRFNEAWLMRRFSVKPGLTCLWQVTGRSDTGFNHWVKLDLEYIDNWSLSLDMRILLKTVPAVLSGSGAM